MKIRGFSLIELVVVIAILGILLSLAIPSFNAWIINTRVRTMAESIQNGMQFARAEAVRRNTTVYFEFVSSFDNLCTLVPTGAASSGLWMVSLQVPNSNCGSAISDTVAPMVVQRRFAENATNITVTASIPATTAVTSLAFNSLGRLTLNSAASLGTPAKYTVAVQSSGSTCADAGGTVRCLNVTVTAGGSVRMCDPALNNVSPNFVVEGC